MNHIRPRPVLRSRRRERQERLKGSAELLVAGSAAYFACIPFALCPLACCVVLQVRRAGLRLAGLTARAGELTQVSMSKMLQAANVMSCAGDTGGLVTTEEYQWVQDHDAQTKGYHPVLPREPEGGIPWLTVRPEPTAPVDVYPSM